MNDSYSYKQKLSVPVGIIDSLLQPSSLFSSQMNATLVNSSKLINSPSYSNSLSLKLSDAFSEYNPSNERKKKIFSKGYLIRFFLWKYWYCSIFAYS